MRVVVKAQGALLLMRQYAFINSVGAYYYYNTEPNKTYEQTMLDVKEYEFTQVTAWACQWEYRYRVSLHITLNVAFISRVASSLAFPLSTFSTIVGGTGMSVCVPLTLSFSISQWLAMAM